MSKSNTGLAMAISISDVIVYSLSVLFFVAIGVYAYGEKRGRSNALKTPNLIFPNIPDITIIGKYQVSNKTPEQLVTSLGEWLNFNGFAAVVFPNMIKLKHVYEPEEARKKKNALDKLQFFRDGIPEDLTLFLSSQAENNMLNVEARCVPFMYRKMGQNVQFLFPRTSVDDAKRLCKEFMQSTMQILQAKTIQEPEAESNIRPIEHFSFLYNSPTENNINKKAHELLSNATRQILITGWVDREFIGDIENAKKKGANIRLITKSPESSDKIIREDFKRLLEIVGKENIRINSRCHDRFLICEHECIVGSMYYTDASKTRFESVIYTDNKGILESLLDHFERIWRDTYSTIPK
jgi:hypothetical protein